MTIDAFSAADSDASTSDETLSATTEYKYAQMAVPAFKIEAVAFNNLDTTISSTTTAAQVSGNSFLRMGSSAVTASGTDSSATMTATGDAPPGFASSLTLAKMVGDVASIAKAEATDDSAPGDVLRDDPYKGSDFVGFADDTRYRNTSSEDLTLNNTAIDNLTSNRKIETKRLLTKGGWWDHSDGNRISTTAGDKVEVIQGNYKLVVLGRQAPSSATVSRSEISDMSGGHTFSKRYEYLADEKCWATFEESSTAHATKKTSGVEVTYFEGSLKETQVGTPSSTSVSKYFLGKGQRDPDVISRTWAQRIETYIGSVDKPVPHIVFVTFAHLMEDTRFCSVEHSTVRSAPAVVSANIGAAVVSMNLAALVMSINKALQIIDVKSGLVHNIHAVKTGLYGKQTKAAPVKQTLSVADDLLSASKTAVVTNNTAVVANNTQVVDKSLEFATEKIEISKTRMMFNLEYYML